MKIHRIKIPIYTCDLYLFLDCSLKECKEYCSSKYKVSFSDNVSMLGCFFPIENKLFIWMGKFCQKPFCYNILVHELSHAASHIISKAGIEADFDNDEAYAYLIGFLMGEIMKRLLKDHGKSGDKHSQRDKR